MYDDLLARVEDSDGPAEIRLCSFAGSAVPKKLSSVFCFLAGLARQVENST